MKKYIEINDLKDFSKIDSNLSDLDDLIVLENGKPKYVINKAENFVLLTENEKLEIVAKRILHEHINAFKELAK